MTSERYTVRDILVEHPLIDAIVAFVIAVCVAIATQNWTPPNLSEFLVGLAAVSAGVLTAATFVCTLTYQSNSLRVVKIRAYYADQIRKNWTSIFSMVFAAAVLPLVGLLFVEGAHWTGAIAAWSLSMLVFKAMRTLFWLNTMLFMQQVEDLDPAITK